MSEHSVNVIEIGEILPHPNADKLDIIPIEGWQVISQKGNFKVGDKAIYIEPDYVVPTTREEFSFLAKSGRDHHRLKAIRLRQQLSYGLLIPVPDELKDRPVGANVMEELGIVRYEPQLAGARMFAREIDKSNWPKLPVPKFDLENWQRYKSTFAPGEEVIVTEKIDGANARFMYCDGKFHIGSRNRWLQHDGENPWSKIVNQYPGIEEWCLQNENVVLFGELFGHVQKLRYGRGHEELSFAAFAAFDATTGNYIDQDILFATVKALGIDHAPVLYRGPFDIEKIKVVANWDSTVAWTPKHIQEGVVIVPALERKERNLGRVALKLISDRYWEMKD